MWQKFDKLIAVINNCILLNLAVSFDIRICILAFVYGTWKVYCVTVEASAIVCIIK
jgi:hypothetical protein